MRSTPRSSRSVRCSSEFMTLIIAREARRVRLCRGGQRAILANWPHMQDDSTQAPPPSATQAGAPGGPTAAAAARPPSVPREIGGPPGPEPTRFGDWERQGRCIDF
ncbi:MAG: DUF1674 domain-containing protein [Steroidobacteraceae bacterium]